MNGLIQGEKLVRVMENGRSKPPSGMSPCRSVRLIWMMLEEKGMQIKTAFGFPPVCLMHHPHTERFISRALMEFDEEFERMTLEARNDRTLHPYQKKYGVNREER